MKQIKPNDPETRSADLVQENLDRLKALFPDAFVEGKVDFEVLKQLLGGTVETRDEKYGLQWHGKRMARQLALTPSTGTLLPVPEESVEWDSTKNLMLEGDNLEVLKLLQKSFSGQVKLIYIDPPYNTGNDFVYHDDYKDGLGSYLQITGQVDGGGYRTSTNKENSGRYHTDWLNMMFPRLLVARQLLADDGVIFISIDDNEVDNLRKCADEIFGEENRIAVICHKSRASVSNDKIISSNHNFILLYARNLATIFARRSEFGLDPDLSGFDREDARGPYKYAPVDGPGGASKGNPHYTFLGVTGYFRFSQERMQAMHAAGLIEKVGNGLQQKYYLSEARQSRKTDTTWWDDKLYTATASARLKELMGGEVFDSPKPIELVQRMLSLWARTPNDVVLDFFAGSGTTAHACMLQTAVDGVPRRFVLVQLPERLDPEAPAQKAAAEYCRSHNLRLNIAEITKRRLRLARQQILDDHTDKTLDLGFRNFRLATSNITAWRPDRANMAKSLFDSVEHVAHDRSPHDLLFEVLLRFGLDLCVPTTTKTIANHAVTSVGAGTLFVCLESNISTTDVEALAIGLAQWHAEIRPATDSTCVFRDSAFVDDVAKSNLVAILQQHGLTNVRSL